MSSQLMPSPYTHLSQILLQYPSFSNTSILTNTSNANYTKFSGNKRLSLSTTKQSSQFIHTKGLSFNDKFNGLPIKQTLDFDEKTSKFQVQSFLDSIQGIPTKGRIEILNNLKKNGKSWSLSEFNDLLMNLVIANELDLALYLYSNVSTLCLVPDCWTLSIIVNCHCKRNDVDEARCVLDYMLENGLNPSVVTFTTLINSYCKKGKLQKAFEVMGLMDGIGCKPNIQTYNCLLKGLCYVGRVEEAFDLLGEIKKSPVKPDVYTYTGLMNGFCKVGRSDEAMELLNEAIEIGLTPNVVTFNTLFDGYNKEGRPLVGVGVMKKMKRMNCLPDYISYSTLLRGLLMWRKIRTGLRVYEEMVRNGFEADEKLMNSLLRGLCRKFLRDNELLEYVHQVFEKMTERGCVIDNGTYGLVIQAFLVGKKVDDALSSLSLMIRSGYSARSITINRLIYAFCVEGKIDKAISIIVLMFETRKFPGMVSYNLMIRELNRQGKFAVACNIYGAALVRGMVPNQKPRQ